MTFCAVLQGIVDVELLCYADRGQYIVCSVTVRLHYQFTVQQIHQYLASKLAFGCFFLFVVLDALLSGNWLSFVFLLPFPVGFFYTSVSSFANSWADAAARRGQAE